MSTFISLFTNTAENTRNSKLKNTQAHMHARKHTHMQTK